MNGHEALVHVANTGRLGELLVPGVTVWLAGASREGRRTRWDLVIVEHGDQLVSVDSQLPNRLVRVALGQGSIPMLAGYSGCRPEVSYGSSRFDFRLDGPDGTCFVETKGVTLVVDGCARFPDAPTTRGTRHLRELASYAREGGAAAVIFVVQRADAVAFSPNDASDPEFAHAVHQAAHDGVRMVAFRCMVTAEAITLDDELPVIL
jgi:sugar fermentation stimulation protein A